ncbi:MAG: DUF4390 domain-containing protein [Proteobacteria bacterium]|nr:DUF4390 domain-containing protein [Pseudomonadota bacterium]
MASITHFLNETSLLAYLKRRYQLIMLLSLIGFCTTCANASTISVNQTSLHLVDNVYQLNSVFKLNLSHFQKNALQHGINLTFIIEFDLIHHRTWWLNQKIADVRQQRTLSYHELTRQYQLNINGLVSNYPDLTDALRALGTVKQWQVVDAVLLKKGVSYTAGIHMWLDTSQLPKPLQVNALTNNDWLLDSGWHHFKLNPGWNG